MAQPPLFTLVLTCIGDLLVGCDASDLDVFDLYRRSPYCGPRQTRAIVALVIGWRSMSGTRISICRRRCFLLSAEQDFRPTCLRKLIAAADEASLVARRQIQLRGPRRSGAALRLQGGFEEAKRELMTALDFAREPGWN
jgi:hypothetical protein